MKHYLGICLVLITVALLTLLVINRCTHAAGTAIAQVRDAFASVLQVQPKITVNEHIVQTQTAPIAELAVVSKEEAITLGFDEHEELLSYTLPLTGKKLTVAGAFRVKAGYDLRLPFTVEIDPATNHLVVTMPPAEILSVEQMGDLSFQGEDSVLNRLTDSERAKAIDGLQQLARQSAETSSLKHDADVQIQQRLEELLRHNGQSMEIQWSSSQDKKAPSIP